MAYTTIDNPGDYFFAKTYTGNASTQTITNDVDSDFVWLKTTGSDNHVLFDSVRGVNKYINSDTNALEGTSTAPNLGVTAFNSNGFDLGAWSALNGSGTLYSSYAWKAGTSTGIDFSAGDITPSAYSINSTSGIGIYKYTGPGTVGGDTIAHNLGATPKLLIVKRLSAAYSWAVQHADVLNTKILSFDNSNAGVLNDAFHNTYPTSTLITLGSSTYTNAAAGTSIYVCYAFAPVKGYSAFGVYTGNGSTDGAFVHTGFEPAFIIAKNRDSGGPASYGWTMVSNSFGMGGATTIDPAFNELTQSFFADQNTAVATGNAVDFLSNGFKLRGTGNASNQSTAPYIYMAWARNPFVNSEGIPGNSR